MVRYWDEQINRAIAVTKFRIKHMEKHGMGSMAMQEKQRLVKQLRNKELRDAKLK